MTENGNDYLKTTHHVIELPKSYKMNVLVLKMITLNSNYRLSKIAIKIREIPKASPGYKGKNWSIWLRQKFLI